MNALLNEASKKLGASPEKIKKAAESGNISEILKNLGNKQSEKISQILSDKSQTSKLLSSPQARELMKKLFGGK